MTSHRRASTMLLLAILLGSSAPVAWARDLWTPAQANAWYDAQPWLVGCNYLPRGSINQLEMWQAEGFDPAMIDEEFGWAEGLGFNVMRVYLHDLLWQQDAQGMLERMERLLAIADRHRIRILFVFFDSCWDPRPVLGRQRAPTPRVHNSGWVQSPGRDVLLDPARQAPLAGYVRGVIRHFRSDRRVLGWDIYNELDNQFAPGPYREFEPKDKKELSLRLARQAQAWALEADPTQPITICIWQNQSKPFAELTPEQQFALTASDVISFHLYTDLDSARQVVEALRVHGRPLLCTEWLARPLGSTVHGILPYFREQRVAAINWGLVDGRSQTKFPWDSWEKPYPPEPDPWFHDLLRADGTPYSADEARLIRSLAGKAQAAAK